MKQKQKKRWKKLERDVQKLLSEKKREEACASKMRILHKLLGVSVEAIETFLRHHPEKLADVSEKELDHVVHFLQCRMLDAERHSRHKSANGMLVFQKQLKDAAENRFE